VLADRRSEVPRAARRRIDETEVTLATYGSVIYLSVVAVLAADDGPPHPSLAIGAVVATATVLYVTHVFTGLVPRVAKAGRLHAADLTHALRHDVPLLISAVVPIVPLLLAEWETISVETAYRLSIRVTIGLLFGLAVTLGRREGLGWGRALAAGAVIIAVTTVVIWLESLVH
jgi:hypothetical protein